MNRVFYGWWIVLACWAVTLYGGGAFFFGFSAFFKPISEEFGWSRALTAGAISLSQAEGFIEGPIVGPLVDRFGPRKLMLLGICMVTVGFLALSMVNTLAFFYFVYVVFLAIGFNTGFFVAAQAAVANWFIKKRSRALGLLSTANGFGGAIMAPLVAWLILSFGWRVASVWIGLGMFTIGIPLALVVRHRPEQYGYLPDGEKAPDPPPIDRLSVGTATGSKPGVGEVDFTISALIPQTFRVLHYVQQLFMKGLHYSVGFRVVDTVTSCRTYHCSVDIGFRGETSRYNGK